MMHKELVDVVPTFSNCMKLCGTFYVELMFLLIICIDYMVVCLNMGCLLWSFSLKSVKCHSRTNVPKGEIL